MKKLNGFFYIGSIVHIRINDFELGWYVVIHILEKIIKKCWINNGQSLIYRILEGCPFM